MNERQVAAANANIGIAQTAYYPTLTLSAAPGLLSRNLSNLFEYSSRTWSTGPSLSYTVFDFGRRRAGVVISQATYDATVAGYRETVLSAFQEVEDDLASLRYLAEEAVQQHDAVVAAQEALDLEIERYKAGTDSELNVITTQIITLSDEQTAINILERRMTAAVDLIKALGGGWDALTVSLRVTSSFPESDRPEQHAKRARRQQIGKIYPLHGLLGIGKGCNRAMGESPRKKRIAVIPGDGIGREVVPISGSRSGSRQSPP